MPRSYTEPVARLLTHDRLTDADVGAPWPDYGELGLGPAHVPELIRMATDLDLNDSPPESLLVWAPLHAWRALAQLQAVDAVRPLLELSEQRSDDDWLNNDLPRVVAMIGPPAIPELEAFLADEGVDDMCRMSVAECFVQMGRQHPGERDRCVGALVRHLETFAANGPELNGILVACLMDLNATEAIGLIRRAFSADWVDLCVAGDVEDVEIEMGLRTERSTSRPRYSNGFGGGRGDTGDAWLDGMEDRTFGNVPVRRGPKVGRNEPCPCGSGKKFKKCCLNDA